MRGKHEHGHGVARRGARQWDEPVLDNQPALPGRQVTLQLLANQKDDGQVAAGGYLTAAPMAACQVGGAA